MLFRKSLFTLCGVMGLFTSALAQELLGSYTAEIAPEDRRNSQGAALSEPGAILTQDRANVHRFSIRQPGDTLDDMFTTTERRADLASLYSAGTVTPQARAVLQGAARGLVHVEIWGSGGRPAFLRVDEANPIPAALPTPATGTAIPTFGATPAAPPAPAGGWVFSTDQAGWRASAAVNVPGGGRIALECTKTGADPAHYPGPGILRPHEPGFLNLLLSRVAVGEPGGTLRVNVTIDGTGFGETSMMPLPGTDDVATNVPRDHALIANLRAGTALQLDGPAGRLEIPLLGANFAIDQLLITCETPAGAAPSVVTADLEPADSVAMQAPDIALAEPIGADGLARLEGRVAFWVGAANARTFIGTSLENLGQDERLSRGLFLTALTAMADDLAAALGAAESPEHLRMLFDRLPEPERQRIGGQIATTLGRTEAERARCTRVTGNAIWFCAMGDDASEFDRRRVTELLAREISAVAAAGSFKMPLQIHVICGGQGMDQAYDFDAGAIRWARFVDPGSCRQANMPLSYMSERTGISIAVDHQLDAVMPNTTPMPAAQVEAMTNQSRPPAGPTGGQPYRVHAVTFPGEVRIERTGEPADENGLHPVRVVFGRTGPLDLRWTGAPETVVMTFEAAPAAPVADQPVPLLEAATLADLIADAPALEPPAAAAGFTALVDGSYGAEMRLMHIPAYIEGDRITVGRMSVETEAAQRLAAALGAPQGYVVWSQVQATGYDVEDQEVLLILPRPFADVVSDGLPQEIAAARNPDLSLLVEVGGFVRGEGEVGPALVAFARPVAFVGYGGDDFGRRVLIGRVGLVETTATLPERLFMPDPDWFLMRMAMLSGQDPEEAFHAAYEAAGIGGSDTFARLDAVDAGLAAAQHVASAAENADPWVHGTLSLDAYDLDRQGYPLKQIQVAQPQNDRASQALARVAMPEVPWRGLMLPVPVDQARAMRDSLQAQGSYPVRLRLGLEPPSVAGAPPEVTLREIIVLPRQRGSRPAAAQGAFLPEDILLRVEPVASP